MGKLLSSRGSITRAVLACLLGAALVGALGMRLAPSTAQAKAGGCQPKVTRQPFGSAFDLFAGHNLPVFRYTLTNCNHITAEILNYGGVTQSVTVPDKHGNLADVLLGFKTCLLYTSPSPRDS